MWKYNSSYVDNFIPPIDYYNFNNSGNISIFGQNESGGQGPQDCPFLLEVNPYAVPVNGYLSPIIIGFTLITNLLVCAVLLTRNMRTATNTLLLAMAISDTLTGLWPLPCYLYFYIGGHHVDWVPHSWCYTYFILTEFLPTISHTASIWLTVGLALQRYLLVCHSLDSRRWCSVTNTVKGCIVIFILAIVSQSTRFFDSTYIPMDAPSRVDPTRNMTGCCVISARLFASFEDWYYGIYFIFRVVFIHLVPCTALVILNALLIQTMRKARLRRAQLLKMNRKSECRRLAESNGTTLMLVAVVGLFILVEVPLAIIFIIHIAENIVHKMVMDRTTASIASLMVNFCILLSYPVNFFIYCGMSTQFRHTFKGLFGCSTPVDNFPGGAVSQTQVEPEKCEVLNGKEADEEGRTRCLSMTMTCGPNDNGDAAVDSMPEDEEALSRVPMLIKDTKL